MPNTGWTGNVRTVFGRLGNPSAEAMEIFAAKNKVITSETQPRRSSSKPVSTGTPKAC